MGIKVSVIFETVSVIVFIPPILIRQKFLGALKKYGLHWWENMGQIGEGLFFPKPGPGSKGGEEFFGMVL